MDELTANSVGPGGGHGLLQLWAQDGAVVVRVHDAGTITDPLVGRHPSATAGPARSGLLRVNQLADLVRVHTAPGRTTVCVYFGLAR